VALTFDDGPSPWYTPQVLSILERYGARATFFMLGREAAHHPELVREVAGQGHAVACRGWSRVDLRSLDENRFSEEIDGTNALLRSLSGQQVLGVRPLDGLADEEVVRRLGRRGLATILWSTDPRDWRLPGERRIVRRAVRGLKPGSVLLLHDGGGDRRQTLAALPRILERIARRGYRTVSLAR
jgi:peptidoglycan/xylan/chitin deacetylase (PgdA/CDA1 family)